MCCLGCRRLTEAGKTVGSRLRAAALAVGLTAAPSRV